jgi:single-strand DNA-binding protein
MGEWDERVARFQTVYLIGRLGGDPEPRYLDDGRCVISLGLAVKRKFHSAERKAENLKWGDEPTDWYNLEIWTPLAETFTEFAQKGMRVAIVGSIQTDEWRDKESGRPRSRIKVTVREFDILETRAESELRREKSGQPAFFRDDNVSDKGKRRPPPPPSSRSSKFF